MSRKSVDLPAAGRSRLLHSVSKRSEDGSLDDDEESYDDSSEEERPLKRRMHHPHHRPSYYANEAPPPPPQQSNTGLITLIGVLLLALLCVGGYVLWSKSNASGIGSSSSGADSGALTVTVTATAKVTATATGGGGTGTGSGTTPKPSSNSTGSAFPSSISSRPHTSTTTKSKNETETSIVTRTPSYPDETPSSPSPSPTSTPDDDSPSNGGETGFKAQVLDAHNKVRRTHSAPDLVYNDAAAAFANSWAKRCVFEHSGKEGYGENLFAVFPDQSDKPGWDDPTGGIGSWADEEKMYDYNHQGFSHETGHFTAMVWVGVKSVGCAFVSCPDMSFLSCNYEPPGNWEGQYEQNVIPPK